MKLYKIKSNISLNTHSKDITLRKNNTHNTCIVYKKHSFLLCFYCFFRYYNLEINFKFTLFLSSISITSTLTLSPNAKTSSTFSM